MYQVDERDRVVRLADMPQSSAGSPRPFVMADERGVLLAFYVQEFQPGPAASEELFAIVRFNKCIAHLFGPPNDEAFAGHPLSSRGLSPYGAFRIEDSSWIRVLERMNSVHPQHRPERFWEMQHVIFTFHDSTFECVCGGFDIRSARGSIDDVVPEMAKLLQ